MDNRRITRYFIVFFLFTFSLRLFSQEDKDLLPSSFHADRREALRNLLPANSCAVFFSNPEQKRANDTWYSYHQDPNMYYFSGLTESRAALIIFKEPQKIKNEKEVKEILFVKELDPATEKWTGHLLGEEDAKKKLGIAHVIKNKELQKLPFDFSTLNKIYVMESLSDCISSDSSDNTANLQAIFYQKVKNCREKLTTKRLPFWVASLREIKQPEELVLLRKAVDITCRAHLETMKALQAGMYEYNAQAVIEYMFKQAGSEYVGYPSIVGGGENSCILHYETNRKKLNDKELLVIDAGAEYHGYTADITRTLPVNGNFSNEERQIYNIVLQAQEEGIKACLAGNNFRAPHNAAVAVIQEKLYELGIIKNKADYINYFFHGTSHYLGLDVHDAGNYGKLTAGNVITVEPGIYIPKGSACDPKWWNIGVRIEDDILITSGAPDNLSGKLPRKAEEIEAVMKEESFFNKIK